MQCDQKHDANAARCFVSRVPLDALVEATAFLTTEEQCVWRNVNKYYASLLDHAFVRGYVAAVLHDGYVERMDTFYADGDPLSIIPVLGKQLLKGKLTQDSRWKNATLVVDVAMALPSRAYLFWGFLGNSSFRAIHFVGMDSIEKLPDDCCADCPNLECFTMATPCRKLSSVGGNWLSRCTSLRAVDFSGAAALREVGHCWLSGCATLETVSFAGLTALEVVGSHWLCGCKSLREVDVRACVRLQEVGKGSAVWDTSEHVGWMQDCPLLQCVHYDAATLPTQLAEHIGNVLKSTRKEDVKDIA